ncbi:TOPRIM domain protein [Ferroglobus placidus DSM 10642]|uniref:DNA primase DnaG n=1 Tax=Ferroglobus placidus (strain DSM 10642 / AEDII12DO) TaxID=589924 RepID=D3S1X0_FERPA|nr:DNA primase DnaG [Ferroglobus placidus]ADC64427.1 TOPRIM domain protein [Ferroglobus placidus DSM 10642]
MKAPSDTTKYLIHAEIVAEGVVERPDVVGAIFGQTEGLLGDDLDLRELQKTGRIGRIEVKIESKSGKSYGEIKVPSSLDKIETAILAAALETIERVGPCSAKIKVKKIEDVRASKRKKIIERAKEILKELFEEPEIESEKIVELVRQAVRSEEIIEYGEEKLPAGPAIDESDAIIVVEGRADVLNLLKHGIKNVIAVNGTNIPKTIIELSKKKTVTAFLDGDRGGDLILKELLQVADIDYVARAPEGKGVEDLTQKEIIKALRNKVPVEQILSKMEKKVEEKETAEKEEKENKEEEFDLIAALRKHKEEIEGKLLARFVDSDMNVVKEIPVRDLVKVLKTNNIKASGIIFDGVITQRVVDIAAKKNISYLVGVRLGSVVKIPTKLKIITFDEL